MVEVVDSGLAGVEVRRWEPFGAAVFAFAGAPAGFLDHPVVGSAAEGEVVDVGVAAVLPVRDRVVDLGVVATDGAPGAGAAPLPGVQHNSLGRGRQAFGPPEIQRFTGVLVVDVQVVVGALGGHLDQRRDRDE